MDAALSGSFAAFERSQLLPLLLELQARLGRLTKGGLGYAAERIGLPFSDVYGVASFYALLNTTDGSPKAIRLCGSVPCLLAGARKIAEALELVPNASWQWFPCLGQCDRAPAALVGEDAVHNLTPERLAELAVAS
ncbi:MAG: NAD(P)H-dependent oxidoreductase subunit E [Chloroflexota bacterium]